MPNITPSQATARSARKRRVNKNKPLIEFTIKWLWEHLGKRFKMDEIVWFYRKSLGWLNKKLTPDDKKVLFNFKRTMSSCFSLLVSNGYFKKDTKYKSKATYYVASLDMVNGLRDMLALKRFKDFTKGKRGKNLIGGPIPEAFGMYFIEPSGIVDKKFRELWEASRLLPST